MKHVLVIRLSALGDVALMAPLVREYAEANRDLTFTVAGPPLLEPLFEGEANVHYLGLKKKQSFVKIYRALNAVGADTVVDLHRVNRVGFAIIMLRLRHLFNPHFRIFALHKGKVSRWLYLHHWWRHNRKPQYERYDDVFRHAGLKCVNASMRKCVSADARITNIITQSHNNAIIGVAPFSQHEGKIWPWENSERLALTLAERGYKVLLFGSKEEAPQLESLAARHDNISSVAGKQTFREELEIIKGLRLMVSMDSANMHFASVLGVPVVSIWGATHPGFGFYPQGQDPNNALCADLDCQPCSAFGQKPCRYGDYRCLRAITPEMVVKKIETLIAAAQ